MNAHDVIEPYDTVEVIEVPQEYKDQMNLGDVGMVLERYDNDNFEVECAPSGGRPKWLTPLNKRYFKLKEKDPLGIRKKFAPGASQKMENNLQPKSIFFGSFLGLVGGTLLGAGIGAITTTLTGTLVGAGIGLVLGILTGALTAALVVRTAGTSGGVSIGAYTGMAFGAVLGIVIGALIPDSLRMSANTQQSAMLDALMYGRFETAVLFSFLLAVLGTAVGAWVAGRNFIPRGK